jgi:hypothetical protein
MPGFTDNAYGAYGPPDTEALWEVTDYTNYACGLDEWQSSNGRITKIAELDTDHLLNIVAKLHRESGQSCNGQRNKLVTLEKEALKRLTVLVNPIAQ